MRGVILFLSYAGLGILRWTTWALLFPACCIVGYIYFTSKLKVENIPVQLPLLFGGTLLSYPIVYLIAGIIQVTAMVLWLRYRIPVFIHPAVVYARYGGVFPPPEFIHVAKNDLPSPQYAKIASSSFAVMTWFAVFILVMVVVFSQGNDFVISQWGHVGFIWGIAIATVASFAVYHLAMARFSRHVEAVGPRDCWPELYEDQVPAILLESSGAEVPSAPPSDQIQRG